MNKKILLRKTCSVYASDLHLATMIFPFVNKEIEKGAIIKPILEKDISNSIEKIIKNIGIDAEMKDKIEKVEWTQTNIEKIKQVLKDIEKTLNMNSKIQIIVAGTNLFIEKVNKVIDLWAKVNLEDIEKSHSIMNVINCYSFDENGKIDNIMENHDYMLKTTGIEEIYSKQKLKKAN